jgi:hypothetical protein
MNAPQVPKPIVPPRLATGLAIKDQLPNHGAPRQSEGGKGTVTMPIELLAAVREEPLKAGLGYVFFCSGLTSENGLSVILNRHRLLVSKAVAKSDTVAVSFYYSLLLAECLVLRRSESPLVGRLQTALSGPLYAPGSIARNQVFSDFAMRLSQSPLLATLKTLPIYGPAPREAAQAHRVATITLKVPTSEADAPWKRLSRKREKRPKVGR